MAPKPVWGVNNPNARRRNNDAMMDTAAEKARLRPPRDLRVAEKVTPLMLRREEDAKMKRKVLEKKREKKWNV